MLTLSVSLGQLTYFPRISFALYWHRVGTLHLPHWKHWLGYMCLHRNIGQTTMGIKGVIETVIPIKLEPQTKKWQLPTNYLFRIVALLGLVELLFEGLIPPHATQANPPYKNFRSTPLPSQRDLWEARTNRSWKRELKRYLSGRTSQEVLTVGDLLELDSAGCFKNTWNNQQAYTKLPDAVSWCGNSDSLGMLIWMVLPFQKWRKRDALWWYNGYVWSLCLDLNWWIWVSI